MNVCYILATSDLEGAARSFLDLMTNYVMRNINAYAIIPKKNKDLENELKQKKIKYKIIRYCTESDSGKFLNIIKMIINIYAKKRIKKFLMTNRIDIVHNNSLVSIVGMEVADTIKIPYICHIREVLKEGLNIDVINENKIKTCLQHSTINIAISNIIKEKYNKICKNKVIRIYDNIDIKKYLNRDKKILNSDITNIILVGRICTEKGQLDAVKAIKYINDKGNINIHLTIIGNISDKKYYEEIKNYIDNFNIKNVSFHSFSSNLSEIRKNMDISLTCSIAEGLGRVTIEGMLDGEIVIGSKGYGTSELIENNKTGFIYDKGNYRDLANKIIYIINNREECQNIAKKGQEYAIENFYNNDLKIIKIYNNIMEKKV